MEKGFCLLKLCRSKEEVSSALSSVKRLAETGRA